jgi:hypothetical protein
VSHAKLDRMLRSPCMSRSLRMPPLTTQAPLTTHAPALTTHA